MRRTVLTLLMIIALLPMVSGVTAYVPANATQEIQSAACKAEFAATTVCKGQPTVFTDLSVGATSWSWNFGESGSPTLTVANPSYTYLTPGSHTVVLTVNGGACKVTHTVNVLSGPSSLVITGPALTCLPGTYSIPAQPGCQVTWNVTNGSAKPLTGPTTNVTWNSTGNGLVTVTVTCPETCCKSSAQLLVRACTISCCKDVKLSATNPKFTNMACGMATLNTNLGVAGLGAITQMTVSLISTTVIYSPSTCGAGGAAVSYFITPQSQNGFSATQAAPSSNEIVFTAPGGISLAAGLPFKFDIQFPHPGTPGCKSKVSFCIRYTFTDINCKTCSIVECYGPFDRAGEPPGIC